MYQEDSFKTSQVVYAHTRSDEADMEYKMHCHNSYEIYYMVKGNVEYFLEGTSYIPKPGSLLIIRQAAFTGCGCWMEVSITGSVCILCRSF